MYPIVTIGGSAVSMTGIGIIIAIAIFLIVAYGQSKKYNLQFRKIFYWMPLPIILAYILGAYVSFLLTYGKLLPSTLNELLLLISPYDFKFHFIGILVGITSAIILFLSNIKFKEEKFRRIEVIALSLSIAFIPLGFFLLLGDNFIGIPNTERGVQTFRPDISKRSTYGSVIPVGIMISIAGLMSTGIHLGLKELQKNTKVGYLTLATLIILTNIVLRYQQAPKYGVIAISSVSLDIKAYVSFVIVMICIQQYLLQKHS